LPTADDSLLQLGRDRPRGQLLRTTGHSGLGVRGPLPRERRRSSQRRHRQMMPVEAWMRDGLSTTRAAVRDREGLCCRGPTDPSRLAWVRGTGSRGLTSWANREGLCCPGPTDPSRSVSRARNPWAWARPRRTGVPYRVGDERLY
jgi:hypothetical protein